MAGPKMARVHKVINSPKAETARIAHFLSPVPRPAICLIMCKREATAPTPSGFTIDQIGGIVGHARPHAAAIVRPFKRTWLVYYGDVHAGTIAMRSGNPADTDPWALELWLLSGRPPLPSTSRAPTSRPLGARFYRTGPRPIFRNGEISATGRRRNIGASTAASACRMIDGLAPEAVEPFSARLDLQALCGSACPYPNF
jgi:hypothetical protein